MTPKAFPGISVMAVLRIAVVALLILSCLKVIQPFLGALTWAAIIAISAWPLHTRMRQRFGGRAKLSATLIVMGLALTLAIPIGLMVTTLADTVPQVAGYTNNISNIHLPDLPSWITTLPMVGDGLHKFWTGVQVDLPGFLEKARPAINKAALWILEGGASASLSMLEIVLAIVVAGVLLVNGDKLWDGAELAITRLGGATAGELPEVIARTIRSVTTGVVGTALAQTVLCVIGLLIAGVPGSLVLGFLCFVIAVAQLPTLLVWLPAAGWVFYTGNTGMGVFLLLWGFLLVNTIDNILKPLLISQGAKLPLSIIFMGVIGGLLAWGLLGLFIGPTLLAVGFTLVRHWLEPEEFAESSTAPAGQQQPAQEQPRQ